MQQILFRHLTASDFVQLIEFVTDSKVTKYLTWEPYSDTERIKGFLNNAEKCSGFPNEFLAIIFETKLIGTVHIIDRQNGCIQFGFGITSDYWGQGLGDGIVKATLNYINTSEWQEKTSEIWADIHRDNIFAKQILIKNGFIRSGTVTGENNRERLLLKCPKLYKRKY